MYISTNVHVEAMRNDVDAYIHTHIHQWWTNFYAAYQSYLKKTGTIDTILKKYNARFCTGPYPYIEFETDEERLAFILKWS
jgi:hypothetical protein